MEAQMVLSFLQSQRFAVEASVGGEGPQAAVVGFAVSNEFEIVLDTLASSRKAMNPRSDLAK